MANTNIVLLTGFLGKNAKTTKLTSGSTVTEFSLATTSHWTDRQTGEKKSKTTWVKVVLWNRELLTPYLTTGMMVSVQGSLENNEYQDSTGKTVTVTRVKADEVNLLKEPANAKNKSMESEARPHPEYPDSMAQPSVQ